MRDGYLLIETDPAHPGLIRLRGLDAPPPSRSDDTRFVGHFNDVDAALMHFHEGLKRHLLDVATALALCQRWASWASGVSKIRRWRWLSASGGAAIDSGIASTTR